MVVPRISCNKWMCLVSAVTNLCVLPGAETAQLIERPAEKPGAIRMRVRVPGAARDFSPGVNFPPELTSSADSLTVSAQPPCAVACINTLCARYNSHTLAATPLFGHTEILHTLIGMGSAALAAAVPYPGMVT